MTYRHEMDNLDDNAKRTMVVIEAVRDLVKQGNRDALQTLYERAMETMDTLDKRFSSCLKGDDLEDYANRAKFLYVKFQDVKDGFERWNSMGPHNSITLGGDLGANLGNILGELQSMELTMLNLPPNV